MVGGTEASAQVPYQASLQLLADTYVFAVIRTGRKNWTHNCGGSIITRRNVVTAAHCIANLPLNELSVVVGTNDLSNGGTRHLIAASLVHPNYVELQSSDIGIIRVIDSFTFSDAASATQLAKKNYL